MMSVVPSTGLRNIIIGSMVIAAIGPLSQCYAGMRLSTGVATATSRVLCGQVQTGSVQVRVKEAATNDPIAGAVVQFLIAAYLDIGLVPILLIVWGYIGLMTKEFFARQWLLARPAVYLVSHMLVMPLIAFYVSSFDWLCDCREVPQGLAWLLLLSFCCGLVLELGRKIKVPASERFGVETYSALWGSNVAVTLWFASLGAAVLAYTMAAVHVSPAHVFVIPGACVLLVGLATALIFPGREPRRFAGAEKIIEPSSGLVTLLLYFGLGPLPVLLG